MIHLEEKPYAFQQLSSVCLQIANRLFIALPTHPILLKFCEWYIVFLQQYSYSFDPKLYETFKIVLPPKGQSIGAYIDTDEDYIIPILCKISKDYDLYDQIPL
jgi:hypothetical protein